MLHIAPSDVRLSAYMSKVDEFLAEARALKADLQGRLSQVEATISAFEKMKRDVPADTLERILARPAEAQSDLREAPQSVSRSRALTPSEVVPLARNALLDAGRPMKRGQLVGALQSKGVVLAGKDANKNLGTILWRHPRDFISVENLGYWVKGVPLDNIYDPERDDQPLPVTTFVRRRRD